MRLHVMAVGLLAVPLIVSHCSVPPQVAEDLVVNGAKISVQHVHHHREHVVAWVNVTVYTTPKAFEAYTKLEYKRFRHGQWIVVDEHTYRKGDLPEPDHTKNLQPELLSECATGWWRVTGHIIGKTSTDNFVNIDAAWPSKKGERFRC